MVRGLQCAGRMNPKALQLQERTRDFAARVITFCAAMRSSAARQIAEQLVDAAGSTDSNYRAACRARSPAEFIAKLGTAVEEADESKGWLQLLVHANLTSAEDARDLIGEADELVAIFVASKKTAERRKQLRDELKGATRGRGRRG